MQVSVPFSPDQASTFAESVDTLYGFLWALTILFGVGITLTILYFAVKYRRRSETEVPHPVAGSMRLEVLWSVIPFFVSMGIFVWGASIYFNQYRPPEEALVGHGTGASGRAVTFAVVVNRPAPPAPPVDAVDALVVRILALA